jgi:hypothetical protein
MHTHGNQTRINISRLAVQQLLVHYKEQRCEHNIARTCMAFLSTSVSTNSTYGTISVAVSPSPPTNCTSGAALFFSTQNALQQQQQRVTPSLS